MHGSGFACMVLDPYAWCWIYLHNIHRDMPFLGSVTGEIHYVSTLGTCHFDIRSQGFEMR